MPGYIFSRDVSTSSGHTDTDHLDVTCGHPAFQTFQTAAGAIYREFDLVEDPSDGEFELPDPEQIYSGALGRTWTIAIRTPPAMLLRPEEPRVPPMQGRQIQQRKARRHPRTHLREWSYLDFRPTYVLSDATDTATTRHDSTSRDPANLDRTQAPRETL